VPANQPGQTWQYPAPPGTAGGPPAGTQLAPRGGDDLFTDSKPPRLQGRSLSMRGWRARCQRASRPRSQPGRKTTVFEFDCYRLGDKGRRHDKAKKPGGSRIASAVLLTALLLGAPSRVTAGDGGPRGCCQVEEISCFDNVLQAVCTGGGGQFTLNGICTNSPIGTCEASATTVAPAPAVSSWGLLVIVLALVALAASRLKRRAG
jgi:hypothetical protein